MVFENISIRRVVVTGGRNFTDGARIEADLRALLPLGLERVAEGQCPLGGADDLAYDAWHLLRNESTARYPMDRRIDGQGGHAYLCRNVRMLKAEAPDLVLAYPDTESRGTWHTVKAALAHGMPVAAWCPWLSTAEALAMASKHNSAFYDDDPRWIMKPRGSALTMTPSELALVLRG